ncbi:hypothetical protein MGG_16210 [Pyricularia oryzae 70-15]|uniref:Uncharacterized protein n=1 Tax=Pyricularia oryzae (strain 70-15 / ATCC MYA-4617 / FGSC 8958) TaxID=242507 RepID=G4MMZ8_PYRO7|nr:uncharacterized protein MGG_16210 [Pyricularia oryzae 70-15]EHA57020.1 hypothetical protein MGG_16210 [Pyricularia oryzae 70-15]KAI7929741.1 hypothetical protein M9X92_001199 [Pyricularia oryzae]KAI7931059.1 hypothetical protein M0657_001421 [Pyricularia oryzae]
MSKIGRTPGRLNKTKYALRPDLVSKRDTELELVPALHAAATATVWAQGGP